MLLMSSGTVLDELFVFLIVFCVCFVVNGVAVWEGPSVHGSEFLCWCALFSGDLFQSSD